MKRTGAAASGGQKGKRRKKSRREKVQLNIRTIEGNAAENMVPLVLIEGDQTTLEFLGNFILEQARHPRDCGIQIFPKGSGRFAFSPKSEMGLTSIGCLAGTS
ncbi:MAG TPA: hypothetical protein VEV17_24410 [Bryobacteraceae bacterium]|nr:hypothetical protein [Bryobacteraceae bacterium]